MIWTYKGQQDALTEIANKVLFVKLIMADFDETLKTVNGDLTYASFTGSAAQLVSWGAVKSKDCGAVMEMVPQVYTCVGTPLSPETIYGFAIVDGTTGPDTPGTNVEAVHKFESPVLIAADGDSVVVNPVVSLAGCG